ncbi:hypothetical protein AB1Y20_010497 [Prymnesium parvum]|uniref:Uncharacterized protein n=1 Tax=Prymnesium parvum TaxID=97485 RepID=A0AB34IPF3_PRYPA
MLAHLSRNLAEHIRRANSSISVDGSDAATAKQYPPAWTGSVAGLNDSLKGTLFLTLAGRYLATPNDAAVEDDRTPKILLKSGKAKDPDKRTRDWAEAHITQYIPGLLLPTGAAGRPDLKVSVVGARHVPVELELAPGETIERLQLSVAGGVPRTDTVTNILNLIGMQSASARRSNPFRAASTAEPFAASSWCEGKQEEGAHPRGSQRIASL